MKIAITGHTGGIGKAIAERYEKEGAEILGFSLENGYDLSVFGVTSFIAQKIHREDCDVLFMVSDVEQEKLFTTLFDLWKYKPKDIFCVSGLGRLFVGDNTITPYPNTSQIKYQTYQTMLKSIAVNDFSTDEDVKSTQSQERLCRVMNITPGWVWVERQQNNKHAFSNRFELREDQCLSIDELVDQIYYIQQMPRNIEIFDMVLSKFR